MLLFLLFLSIINPDIIIITLDTLRKDHISYYDNKNAKTFQLDNIAKESIVFKDAITTVPLTLPAHFSLFTGLYPFNHKVRDNGQIYKENHPTLAEILNKNGYETFAFVSSNILNKESNLFKGFNNVYSKLNSITEEASCFETLNLIESIINNLKKKRPIFLWVHFFDPHYPYMPVEIDEINTKKSYIKEVENLDFCVGKLYDYIKIHFGDYNILVLLSDHGESLEENNEKTHGFYLFEPTIQIPLFIKLPDMKGKQIEGQVSIIDIFPTILSYLKLYYPKVDGLDLLPYIKENKKIPDRELFIESYHLFNTFNLLPIVGIREEGKKLIWGYSIKYYNLEKGKEENVSLTEGLQRFYIKKLKEIKSSKKEENSINFRSLGYLNPFEKKLAIKNEADLEDIVKKSEEIICNTLTGKEFLKRGDMEKSINYFDKSLEMQPNFYDGLIFKSIALIMKNEPSEAIKILDRINLKNNYVYYLYGWAYLRKGMGKEAEAFFRKSLQANVEIIDFQLGLAKSLVLQGKFYEAKLILKKILEKDKDHSEAKTALQELDKLIYKEYGKGKH